MEQSLLGAIHGLLGLLALPEIGLSAIFVVSLVSATLLPLGSEPAVFGYVKLSPDMFWPAVLVATAGNTIGGIVSYAMGAGAHRAVERWRETHPHHHHSHGTSTDGVVPGAPDPAPAHAAARAGAAASVRPAGPPAAGPRPHGRWHAHAHDWLHRVGPAALLLSWLPAVGDPLCAVAGWLRLTFWPCVAYMALGKLLRYVSLTAGLLWATSGVHF